MRFGGYELIEKIGVGGMAEVYRARTVSPQGVERTLVIKKILPEYAANQSFIRMLVAEARVSSLLHHGNIVQIFELGEIEGQYYIAMEYVPGPDLLAVLRATTHTRLRVPLELALFIVSEICNGLDYAHKATDGENRPLNLIHRDISPSNIIISDQGAVKLMDFGVASADLTRKGRRRAVEQNTGALKGKVGYMSPEQVTGQPVDHRADLFALGIVLFETLTLKRLFVGPSEPQTLANIRDAPIDEKLSRHTYIPSGVQTILHRALAKDPADRYPHAAAFREALLDYLFDQRMRVTNRKLARFISDLNWSTAPNDGRSTAQQPTPPTPEVETAPPTQPSTPDLKKAQFSLRRVDGQPIDPIGFQTLASLINRRAVTPEEAIRVNDGPWTTVQNILSPDDIPSLLTHHAATTPVRQGPNNRVTLPALIHDLITSRADATLYVCDGDRAKTLTFRRGALVQADSTDREELLGHFMLSHGLLDANQLAQAIIRSAERGMRLGEALVADGTVEPHALADVLQAQLHARILELLGWDRGWYAVYDGTATGSDVTLDGVDGLELLIQGLRAHWTLTAFEHLFEELMERTISFTETHPTTAPRLPLTPQESRLHARLSDGQTVTSVLDGLDDDDRLATLRILFLQQRTGRINLGSTP